MDDRELLAIVEALAEAARRVETTIRLVPANRWEEVIQTGDGAWTRRQLLAHLAANDLRQLVRVRIGAGIPEPGDEPPAPKSRPYATIAGEADNRVFGGRHPALMAEPAARGLIWEIPAGIKPGANMRCAAFSKWPEGETR